MFKVFRPLLVNGKNEKNNQNKKERKQQWSEYIPTMSIGSLSSISFLKRSFESLGRVLFEWEDIGAWALPVASESII